ncbi:hypothetical protein, partial [Nocardioides sp. XL1]|uniref:hypothetical protein n=1 Tax=Nocardioides sp. XL1 TaxID=2003120 RepID=UPI001A9062C2
EPGSLRSRFGDLASLAALAARGPLEEGAELASLAALLFGRRSSPCWRARDYRKVGPLMVR